MVISHYRAQVVAHQWAKGQEGDSCRQERCRVPAGAWGGLLRSTGLLIPEPQGRKGQAESQKDLEGSHHARHTSEAEGITH